MRKICFPYKRMISMLLVLICMLGLLPTAALAADAPGLHQDGGLHSQRRPLGVSQPGDLLAPSDDLRLQPEKHHRLLRRARERHGLVPGGADLGQSQAITDPTVQTMMAYYYAHTTGVFTDQAHAWA